MPSPSFPPAKKRLGQNFLIDPNIVRKIVALAALGPDDHVLEIGPGRGILTDPLCRTAGRVTAIEIDPRLYDYLKDRQPEFPNLKLRLRDALTHPLDALSARPVSQDVETLHRPPSQEIKIRLSTRMGRFFASDRLLRRGRRPQ